MNKKVIYCILIIVIVVIVLILFANDIKTYYKINNESNT